MPADMMKESKELRQHALRVMGFVEKCIARIHSQEKLDAIVRQLGRHHVISHLLQKRSHHETIMHFNFE